jgi:Tol biopolymer transport system component
MTGSIGRRIAAATLLISLAGCGSTAPPAPAATASMPAPSSPASSPTSRPTLAIAELPVYDADEPLVLYTRLTGAGGGVFVLRPDGTGLAQLGKDVLPGVHKRGDWSPDGTRVVFIDEPSERMYIAHLDGSPTEDVPTCDVPGCDFPAWSPDGTKIAFSRYENGAAAGPAAVGVYVLDLATNDVHEVVRLTRPLLADTPRWSGDGTQIVFSVDQMDDDAFDTGATIGVVPVDGGKHRFLTRFDRFASLPDWSWHSDEIVYSVQLIDTKRVQEPGDATWDLWVIKADGTGGRQLTHVPNGHRLAGPRWTPDGAAITAWELTDGHAVLVDPKTGALTPFATPGLEARPILRRLATSG